MITSIIATLAVLCAPIAPGTTGWRFNKGNICVQDQTAGKVMGGLADSTKAWSKAPDINLILKRSCAGYPRSQTITVQTFTQFYGACHIVRVWTTGGYMKPGRVTRAAVFINTECNTKTLALGIPLGLSERDPNDYGTVMGAAGLPTRRDYRLIERIYPW
jgi:hypothetical protein